VKVIALNAPMGAQVRQLGFMAGQISVPDDFDRMGTEEIERVFVGGAMKLCWTHTSAVLKKAGQLIGEGQRHQLVDRSLHLRQQRVRLNAYN